MNPDNGLFYTIARNHFGLDLEEVNACLGSPARCREVMTAAGFVNVSVTESGGEMPMYAPDLSEYAERIWRMSAGSPFAPIEQMNLLSMEQVAEFKSMFVQQVQEAAKERWDGKFVRNPYKAFYVVGRKEGSG